MAVRRYFVEIKNMFQGGGEGEEGHFVIIVHVAVDISWTPHP